MAKAEEIWKCPQCGARVDIAPLGLYAEVACPECHRKERVHVQLGNFRLEGVLGVGGMSVVYRAVDVALKRSAALKVLNDTFREQPERIERFENESAMMARVRHENVTSVYSAGRAYGQFYIAMELVEGKNLETMVSEGHPMQAENALEIVRQVAEGLKAASDAGVLHRDMKPGNILITEEGRVKVIDFGLALDNTTDDQEEVIWATPYYVPPETLRREPEDVRTDIYALGMTLRFLLTGEETFGGGMDSLTKLLECKRKLPSIRKKRPDLVPSLGDLTDHMTMFAAGKRPANYDELLEEIDEVAAELEARGAITQGSSGRVRNMVAAVIVLILGYVVGVYAPRIYRDPDTVPRDRVVVNGMDVTPPFVASLTKGLDLLDDEEYDEAAQEFLEIAEEEREPCVGGLAAYLARVLGHAVVLRDVNVSKQAQALLEQHIKRGQAGLPVLEKARKEMQSHVEWMDPTPSEWYTGKNGWEVEPGEDINAQADRLVNEAPTSPLTPVLLQELAEHALWLGQMDAVEYCREKMRELQSKAGAFAPIAKLFNRVIDGRLKERAVAKYLGQRDRIIARMQGNPPTEEDAAELAGIAANPLLPEYFRQQLEVQSQAAKLAVAMGQVLQRKGGERCKPGMSFRHLLWVSRYVGEMPMLTCKTQDVGYHVTCAMDGDMDTRWRADDAGLGENLRIQMPRTQRLSKVVMYWVDDAELTYTLTAYNKGREVRRIQRTKNTQDTTFIFGNIEVDSLTLSLDKTDWHRASVREIEMYDERMKRLYTERDPTTIDPKGQGVIPESNTQEGGQGVPIYVRRSMELVADVLDEPSENDPEREEVVPGIEQIVQEQGGRGSMQFKVIAETWREMLHAGQDAREIPPEPLGEDREAALNRLIDRCGRCYVTRMEKGYWMRYLNFATIGGDMLNILDEQEMVFLRRENASVLAEEPETVPVLGLKTDRKEAYTLIEGDIQPVPERTARLFEEAKSGVILKSVADLQPYLDVMKPNPTPFVFGRVPRYKFQKN